MLFIGGICSFLFNISRSNNFFRLNLHFFRAKYKILKINLKQGFEPCERSF